MFIIIDYRIFGLTFKNIIQEQSKPIFAKLFATIRQRINRRRM